MEVVLSGCPSCCRHVRASETSCPFCHAAIGSNARRAGRVRIGLAAACAIGLGTVTIAACSSSSPGVSVVYGPPVIPECADAVFGSADHAAARCTSRSITVPGSTAAMVMRFAPMEPGPSRSPTPRPTDIARSTPGTAVWTAARARQGAGKGSGADETRRGFPGALRSMSTIEKGFRGALRSMSTQPCPRSQSGRTKAATFAPVSAPPAVADPWRRNWGAGRVDSRYEVGPPLVREPVRKCDLDPCETPVLLPMAFGPESTSSRFPPRSRFQSGRTKAATFARRAQTVAFAPLLASETRFAPPTYPTRP